MASSLHLYREEKMKQKKVPFFSFFEAKEVNFLSEMLWLIVLHRNEKEELMNWRTRDGGRISSSSSFFFSLFWIVFFAAKWVNFSRKMHVLISYKGKDEGKKRKEKTCVNEENELGGNDQLLEYLVDDFSYVPQQDQDPYFYINDVEDVWCIFFYFRTFYFQNILKF